MTGPVEPSPGSSAPPGWVGDWASLTPQEQVAAWQQIAMQQGQAIQQSQDLQRQQIAAQKQTTNTLLWIFLYIPLILAALVLVVGLIAVVVNAAT